MMNYTSRMPVQKNVYSRNGACGGLQAGLRGAARKQVAGVGVGDVRLGVDDLRIMHEALESLYEDQIFPEEKIVKARLQAQPGFHMSVLNMPGVLQNFVDIYRAFPGYTVSRDHNNVTSICLKHYSGFRGWVDEKSDEDTYPEEMWQEFAAYLQETAKEMKQTVTAKKSVRGGTFDDLVFNRGRYGFANSVYQRGLPCLAGRSLGEVCHIVELAIQKKLLAYENNMLLPGSFCQSRANALVGRPTRSSYRSENVHPEQYVQTVDELMAILRRLMAIHRDGFNLSTLKEKIRKYEGLRMSETIFHQTKLLELMRMDPIDQVVSIVKLEDNCGYLVQPVEDFSTCATATPASRALW